MPNDLHPEFAIARPTQPFGRPPTLGIGREGDGHAEAVAPPGHEWIALLGGENQLARRLRPGGYVTEQEGCIVKLDVGNGWRWPRNNGRERLFVDRGLAGGDGFLGEYLWNVAGVLGL